MSATGRTSRAVKVLCGLAVGATTVSVWNIYSRRQGESKLTKPRTPFTLPLNKVLASWTTNFEPTAQWDFNWDRRDPKSIVKPPKGDSEKAQNDYANQLKLVTPTATRHLFLIRHGQYNLQGQKDTDKYLTKLGQQQADLTGKRLKELNYPYDIMIHSTMTRAKESAELIHAHLPQVPMVVDDLLKEGAPIPPEPPIGQWKSEKDFFQDGARIEAGFRKYFHRAPASQTTESYEVLVCHANVIRYFVCRALQLPPEAWLRMSLHNGSITWLVLRPSGRVSMRTLGDCGHMSPDRLTVT